MQCRWKKEGVKAYFGNMNWMIIWKRLLFVVHCEVDDSFSRPAITKG
jgi:hypothetical protein